MPIDLTIYAADRAAVIADMPIDATIGGAAAVSCRKSTLSETDRAAAAGELEDYTFSLHTVAANWATAPAIGDLVTVSEIEYRILRIIEDAVGLRLDCGAKYTNRVT